MCSTRQLTSSSNSKGLPHCMAFVQGIALHRPCNIGMDVTPSRLSSLQMLHARQRIPQPRSLITCLPRKHGGARVALRQARDTLTQRPCHHKTAPPCCMVAPRDRGEATPSCSADPNVPQVLFRVSAGRCKTVPVLGVSRTIMCPTQTQQHAVPLPPGADRCCHRALPPPRQPEAVLGPRWPPTA